MARGDGHPCRTVRPNREIPRALDQEDGKEKMGRRRRPQDTRRSGGQTANITIGSRGDKRVEVEDDERRAWYRRLIGRRVLPLFGGSATGIGRNLRARMILASAARHAFHA